MADAIIEQIAQNVLTTAQTVTIANEFTYNLAISRAKKKNTPRHLSGFIYQLTARRTDPSGATMADEWTQPFLVDMYVLPTDDDSTPLDVYNNNIFADLYEALMEDYTRGGLAINTVIHGPMFMPPIEGEIGGLMFLFDVQYRNRVDNPRLSAT